LHKDAPCPEKPVEWVGSTKQDLTRFPVSVKRIMGQALFEAQCGLTHQDAKPMRGNLRSVTEICAGDERATYRAVYTTKIGNVVYALSAFQKKSKDGIRTPQRHLALIAQRLKEAKAHYERFYKKGRSRETTSRQNKRREANPRKDNSG
jgi:phage-related protein